MNGGCLRPQDARLEDFILREMRRQMTPGVAIGVIGHEGKVRHARGYGDANVELHVPVTTRTVFQAASLGKQFTATAIMLQVEDGKLGLEEPIRKFFPEAPSRWATITVRNLLNHSSGIPNFPSAALNLRNDYSEDDLLRIACGLPLEFRPGTGSSYSNTGYVLLGFIVRRVSGASYGEILRDRVFSPLGMKTARVISEADIVPDRASGYRLVDGGLKNQEWVSPSLNATADGSLYLSLDDWIAWDRAMRASALLTARSWSAIHTPATIPGSGTHGYGFGWEVNVALDRPWYYHRGTWQGFRCIVSRYLADDLTVFVLTNLADANPARFVDGIVRILNPRLPTFETSEVADRAPSSTTAPTVVPEHEAAQ